MSRTLQPTSGYTTNPETEITSSVVGVVEFLEIDLPTGNLYLTNAPRSYVWGGNTYAPITGSGALYGSMVNFNESTDSIPRPMTLELSGVDPTLISDVVGNNVQWVPIMWSIGLIDAANNLLNGVPIWTTPLFLGDCTIALSNGAGTITISAESLLADMQSRNSGQFQTVADQQARGTSGNTTFSKDQFFTFSESIMWTWLYWGQTGPSNIGVGGSGVSGVGGFGGFGGPGHSGPVVPTFLP